MKKIKNIAVFDDDEYFLAMLKGYCYANNIAMIEIDFNMNGISEVERLKPALVFISFSFLTRPETDLLMLSVARNQVKVCSLTKNSSSVPVELPEWVDVIINNPLDISEIDKYIKKTFLVNNFTVMERRRIERRSFTERRRIELCCDVHDDNGRDHEENKNISFPQETGSSKFKSFEIDQRNKCIFLNGHKIDLTRKEYELFELLSTDADRVFLAEEIIAHIWPENNRATKSDLYQYMHLLRKKIEKDPNHPQWIMTIKGFGYRLNVDGPEEISQEVSCL